MTPPAPVATSAPDDSGRPTGDGHAAAAGTRGRAAGVARVAARTCAALASVLVSALVSVVVLMAGLGHLVGPHGGAGGVPAPVLAALVGFPPTPAADVLAAPGDGASGISLNQFLDNARNLAVSLLGTVTIFFLSVGFLRLLAARGEADEVEKGKAAIKAGVLGFIGVMLAPAVVGVLQTLTGGAGPAA
ncbi:membrane associated rhomboid family serine protease [Pseudonocardia eucalypti]|uniref:pilin n=1 Tax=Pseudonocardia eucalypti TaxID=648755 RepID=UPI001613489B|nr:membrane associated rhomboid family serine protease [Pseudonocardia eucalypti]MBB6380769.1 membrane associated rhomboid family serine protease [Pseudonocardia eucalypti]